MMGKSFMDGQAALEDAGVVPGARLFYLPLGLASSLPSDAAAGMGEAGVTATLPWLSLSIKGRT